MNKWAKVRREQGTAKHADLMVALSRLLRARLLADREQVLDEMDADQRLWSSQLSARLEGLDEALTRLGHFDTDCEGRN